MSYARFNGRSDVYIYENIGGGFTCCGPVLPTPEAMIEHVRQHILEGDTVPGDVIPKLIERRDTGTEGLY